MYNPEIDKYVLYTIKTVNFALPTGPLNKLEIDILLDLALGEAKYQILYSWW